MTEEIVLQADEKPAVQSIGKANAELAKFEQGSKRAGEAAGRMAEQQGEAIVRVVDKSRQQVERIVAQAEKKAQFAGKTGVEKLALERDLLIGKLGGEADKVDRLKIAYDRLIAAEQQSAKASMSLTEAMRNPWEAAKQGVSGMLEAIGPLGVKLAVVGTGVGLLAKGMFELLSVQGKAAEGILNLGARLDLTGKQAFELQAAAQIAGVNIGTLEGASRLLAGALEDSEGTGKKAAKALRDLGVSTFDASGDMREMGPVLIDTLEKLSQIPSASERIRQANAILGRGAKELIPLINSYKEIQQSLKELGVTASEDVLKKLAGADDQIDKMGLSWGVFKMKLAEKIEPIIVPVLIKITGFMAGNGKPWIPGKGTEAGMDEFFLGNKAPGKKEENSFFSELSFLGLGSESRAGHRVDVANQARASEMTKQFAAEQGNTIEGLTKKLKELGEAKDKVSAKLIGGGIKDPTVFANERANFNSLQSQIKDAEARKKAIEESVRKAEEDRRKEAEFREKLPEAQADLQTKLGLSMGKSREQDMGRINKAFIEAMQERNEWEKETATIRARTDDAAAQSAIEEVRRERDVRIAALGEIGATTISQKLELEQKRLAIEEETLTREAELQAAALKAKTDRELEQLRLMAIVRPEMEAEILQRISAINEAAGQAGAEIDKRWQDDIGKMREESQSRQTRLIISEQEKAFAAWKRGFESVFDALTASTQSWGQRLMNIFRATILTPLRDAASTLFARLMTGGGSGGGASTAGGGGGLLGGLFGGLPSFANMGGMLGPGGTPPFMPGGATGAGGGGGMFGGFGGMFGGGGNWLSRLGNLGYGRNLGTEAASYSGFGGMAGGAMLLGGGTLAAMGLQRGGWSGAAMTAGGGALIGAKFGGPMGALIGGAIGLGAGLVRMLFKTGEEKIIAKVKSIYGLTIDKSFAKTLTETIKSQFGGNVDLGLHSPQIRELIELYRMTTDQGTRVYDDRPRGVFLSQSGGSLTQSGAYFNNSLYGYSSGIGSASGLRIMQPNPAQVVNVTIQADGQATSDFLEGRTVQFINGNPETIQNASNRALSASQGRYQTQGILLDPLAAGA